MSATRPATLGQPRRRWWFTPAMFDAIRRARRWPADVADLIRGRDPLLPPRSMIFVGESDFRATGQEFLRHFIELGGLRPTERVLDVGCGIGRMAVPLTTYLSPPGEYLGFDIVRSGIRWCQRHITSRFPRFRFVHADVYNYHYNPRGRLDAATFRFPCEDAAFDFAVLTSVFTHMLRPAVDHYLDEIARTLCPGGRCLATLFLLDPESEAAIDSGRALLPFRDAVGDDRVVSAADPEGAIAFPEAYIRAAFADRGLEIGDRIHRGKWRGRPGVSEQDIVVAVRAG